MQNAPSKWGGGGINVSGEAPFEIRGFSLANAAAITGTAITAASFYEYFSSGSGGLSGIGFVYGIPAMLVGLALKVSSFRVGQLDDARTMCAFQAPYAFSSAFERGCVSSHSMRFEEDNVARALSGHELPGDAVRGMDACKWIGPCL